MHNFDRSEHCRRIASKGGKRTVEKHGAGHMSAIGVKGFLATAGKFRSIAEYKNWLARMGAYQYWLESGMPNTGKFPAEKPLAPWEKGYTEF